MNLPETEEELEKEAICEKCGTKITVYNEFTGILPTESDGEGWTNHTRIVCNLHKRINFLERYVKELKASLVSRISDEELFQLGIHQ